MARRLLLTAVATLAAAFALAGGAQAAGAAKLTFDGGTPRQQAQVRKALAASTFDFSLLPQAVVVHVGRVGVAHARPGEVWLDGALLDSGTFGWATVLDEFAHQVDFLLLDPQKRAALNTALGGRDWCYGVSGLGHSDYGCELFSSVFAWAYWQTPDNPYRPQTKRDESAAMAPAAFRTLLAQLLGQAPAASGRA